MSILFKKFDVRVVICIYNGLDAMDGIVKRIAVLVVRVWGYTTVILRSYL